MKQSWPTLLALLAFGLAVFSATPGFAQLDPADRYSRSFPGEISSAPWWESFGDPALVQLIEQGLADNPGLAAIQFRVDQSRAIAWQVLAPVLPQISVDLAGREAAIEGLGANTVRQFELSGQTVPDSYQSGSAMLVGRLDVDLFGRRILSHLGARKDATAAKLDQDSQAAGLALLIAQAYYDVQAGRKRLQAVHAQIKANEQLLELLQLRYERGDADGLDVLKQKQQLASTATLLPSAKAALQVAKQQLSVLLGKLPGVQTAVPENDLPFVPEKKTIGRPSDLFVNRPDLIAAATRADANRSRKNSAIVTFLPQVQLYGQAGEQVIDIVEKEQDFVWEAGLTLSIPIFTGGYNVANYRQANAAERATKKELRKMSLDSVLEVESALVQEDKARGQLSAFKAQWEAASQALAQSKSRYVSGLTNYQSVLNAMTTLQISELSLIEAQVAMIRARMKLLNAVGGPWAMDLLTKKGASK